MYYGVIIIVSVLQMTQRCDSSRCYDLTCFKDNCLEEAIHANTVPTCEMNESFGCAYTKMVSSSSVMVIAKCAISNCVPLYSAPAHETLCCTDSLCNIGTHVPDKSSATHCHAYTCTSDWDCLQKGISSSYSRTCPLDTRYGCFVHKSQAGSVISVRAGCSDHTCKPITAEVGETRDQYTCCTGNLCNDGTDSKKNNVSGVCLVSPNIILILYTLISSFIYTKP